MELFSKLKTQKGDEAVLDDRAVTLLHAQMLREKKFLRRIYVDFYRALERAVGPTEGRTVVELGSGGGFIKEMIPHAITSDILPLPSVDRVFSACHMPFEDRSLDALIMIDVLHHIPEVRLFFREAVRCLKPGGRIAMIEPANTWWGRFIYTHFHHEPFDPKADWTFRSEGPLSSANGALPWIVFQRDLQTFQREFPELALRRIEFHTPLRYLLSGGFSMRSLVPVWSYPLFQGIEAILRPLNAQLGLFQTIVIEKR